MYITWSANKCSYYYSYIYDFWLLRNWRCNTIIYNIELWSTAPLYISTLQWLQLLLMPIYLCFLLSIVLMLISLCTWCYERQGSIATCQALSPGLIALWWLTDRGHSSPTPDAPKWSFLTGRSAALGPFAV